MRCAAAPTMHLKQELKSYLSSIRHGVQVEFCVTAEGGDASTGRLQGLRGLDHAVYYRWGRVAGASRVDGGRLLCTARVDGRGEPRGGTTGRAALQVGAGGRDNAASGSPQGRRGRGSGLWVTLGNRGWGEAAAISKGGGCRGRAGQPLGCDLLAPITLRPTAALTPWLRFHHTA